MHSLKAKEIKGNTCHSLSKFGCEILIPSCKNFKVLCIAQEKDLQQIFDMKAIKISRVIKCYQIPIFSDSLRVSLFILEEGFSWDGPTTQSNKYTMCIKNKNL